MKVPVLIVGAGPTGLNLALSLARRGVPFRIISDAAGPGEHSRAMAVQARTLEFYAQYGFADEVIGRGIIADTAHFRRGGEGETAKEVAHVKFSDLGAGISPYPFALVFPQDDHEQFLIAKLSEAGAEIEWRSRLTGFKELEDHVEATISRDGEAEQVTAEYVCGCDGAHSVVREGMHAGFSGGTYEQLFYVADVRISRGFDHDLYFNLGEHILAIMFPVRSTGMQRITGLVPPELSQKAGLTFEDVRARVERLIDIEVTEVNWFSSYRVHHRVADRFRAGRAFLAGDAAHIHSPVGGQGMNTGIGDAVNLGWKLAHVIQRRADASILDSYEPERIGFARALVATTDRAFTPLVAEGVAGEFTRRVLAPLVFSVATRLAPARHELFRLISQARIHYPDSPLSDGKAGHVHGGDRLPWAGNHAADNFAPLRSLNWQLHVYGTATQNLETACTELGLALHAFPWNDDVKNAGFKQDAAYLVRPDGYVALALADQSVPKLTGYAERWKLSFRSASLSSVRHRAAGGAPSLPPEGG